jgi:hypothetical protein
VSSVVAPLACPPSRSVPENMEEPCCELERLAWAADVNVENGRERFPFASLRTRVMAMPKGRGADFAAAVLAAASSSDPPRVIRPDTPPPAPPPLAVCFSDSILDARAAALPVPGEAAPLYLARDVVALPYQVFSVRAAGADAICIQAAMWPVHDIGYQCKVAHVLGLACVVELHSHAQVAAVLAAAPAAAALLLCARDPDTLDGDAASFETLYAPFAAQLDALRVPLLAEAARTDDAASAVAACPNAHAVLCGMDVLR